MKKYTWLVVGVMLVGLFLAGCESEEGSSGFKFIVISDIHVRIPGNLDDTRYDNQSTIDNLTQLVARINSEHSDAAFVVATGDLVGCLFSENPAHYGVGIQNPAEKFKEIMDGLSMPYRPLLGNHDYETSFDIVAQGISTDNNAAVEAIWQQVLGIAPYYSFVNDGVRFILLNSYRGAASDDDCPLSSTETGCEGSFDAAQLSWLEGQLQKSEPCVLFMHHPVISDDPWVMWSIGFNTFQVNSNDRFYDIARTYANKIEAIFVGHGHMWAKDTLHGTIPVYETASVGDSGGDKDNFHIVQVDPEQDDYTVTIGNPSGSY